MIGARGTALAAFAAMLHSSLMEPRAVRLCYDDVRVDPTGWEIPEGTVPESPLHDDLCDSAGLGPWLTRDEASAHAARAAEQVARAAEQAARAGEQAARAAEQAAIDREKAALAREEAALRALAEIQRARG